MGNVPGKKVVNADPGDADHVGGNDWDDIQDYLNNVDKTGPVKINTRQYFRSGKLEFRNPGDTFSLVNVFPAITTSNKNINWPLLTADDVPTFNTFAATLDNKTLASTCNVNAITNVVRTDKSNTFGNFNQVFQSGRLQVLTPDQVGKYWIHGQNVGDEFDLLLPLVTGTDYFVSENAEAILANKTLDSTCDISEALTGVIVTSQGTESGSTVDINATSSETDLLNYNVGADSMGANGSTKFLITGYILANSGAPTYTFIVKFGGTNLISCVTGAFGASATKMPFRLEGELYNKNATNAQGASMNIFINDTTAITTGIGSIADDTTKFRGSSDSEGADTSKDTTINQTLQVTVTMSVNNSAVHTVVKHKKVEVSQHA